MRTVCCIALCLIAMHTTLVYGRHHYNSSLRRRLDSIYADDQRYRAGMMLQMGAERDSVAAALHISADSVNGYYSALQAQLDEHALQQVEGIIKRYGYPGRQLVGTPANEAAFYVLQHSAKIKEYFPLLERAAKNGALPYSLVAMMQDRMLRNEGKEQIYGSQYAGFATTDSATHQQRIMWLLWPVKDYAHVNQRRKKAGFKDTVAANAASQGIEPNILTMADLRKNYPWLLNTQ